ncbi:MAG: transposase [Chloroflexota bacterium]
MIHGYSTFSTVCISDDGGKTQLSDITIFSNGDDEHYVRQKELDDLEKKQNKAAKKDEEADLTEREKAIVELLETDEMVNLRQVTHTQLQRVSQTLKKENENLEICHVLDRQFDGLPYFQFIDDELDDFFVIRMKISRNSNATIVNEDGKEIAVKLKDVMMPNTHSDVLYKIILGNKVYQQVKRLIEWGTLTLEEKTYAVVRTTLFTRKGKEIFLQPMLLVTNYTISNYQQAVGIYRIYLKRATIEGVFKFVKNALGWEDLQVRDWESIKNIIALAFFIGGYFYEIESELAHNPVMEWLCALGGGKGKITRHYFLEGLKNLLIHRQVQWFREKTRLRLADWDDILEFAL